MGDHGKLYPTYTTAMQDKMRQLIPYATIMTPNLTELCALLEVPYPHDIINRDELIEMCRQLSNLGPQMVVVTGINIGDEIINFAYEQGKEPAIIKVKRIGDDRSGTGDVISGVIAGSYLNVLNFYQCVEKAVNFASRCIEYSLAVGAHNHLGLCFEPFIKSSWRVNGSPKPQNTTSLNAVKSYFSNSAIIISTVGSLFNHREFDSSISFVFRKQKVHAQLHLFVLLT